MNGELWGNRCKKESKNTDAIDDATFWYALSNFSGTALGMKSITDY